MPIVVLPSLSRYGSRLPSFPSAIFFLRFEESSDQSTKPTRKLKLGLRSNDIEIIVGVLWSIRRFSGRRKTADETGDRRIEILSSPSTQTRYIPPIVRNLALCDSASSTRKLVLPTSSRISRSLVPTYGLVPCQSLGPR